MCAAFVGKMLWGKIFKEGKERVGPDPYRPGAHRGPAVGISDGTNYCHNDQDLLGNTFELLCMYISLRKPLLGGVAKIPTGKL